jgi:hypothetical protein
MFVGELFRLASLLHDRRNYKLAAKRTPARHNSFTAYCVWLERFSELNKTRWNWADDHGQGSVLLAIFELPIDQGLQTASCCSATVMTWHGGLSVLASLEEKGQAVELPLKLVDPQNDPQYCSPHIRRARRCPSASKKLPCSVRI